MGGIASKEATRQIGRLPNQSVTSAAPASHPPNQHDPKLLETSTVQIQPNKNNPSSSSTERVAVQNRSISRARQFGKDLTNMFSFNRQPSRQSTNTAQTAVSAP